MSKPDFSDLKLPMRPRSHVRFTREQYLKLLRDMIESGKSIPWLLKTTSFKRGISPPTLDADSRRAVLRELAGIGNNLNQIARAMNSGLVSGDKSQLEECIQTVRILKSFLGADYGDR